MRKIFLLGFVFLVLVACTQDELPPSPPNPRSDASAGFAYGGIPIPQAQLPNWAGQLQYTDIDPLSVREGDRVTVQVQRPANIRTKFYIYGVMYTFNQRFRVWERVNVDAGRSGKVTRDWVDEKAVFTFPIESGKFKEGSNYLIVYWCYDTGSKENGSIVWNCNNRKWGLGAFSMLGLVYPELIQRPIENNDYLNGSLAADPDGQLFTAFYRHRFTGVRTDVKVLKLANYQAFWDALKTSVAGLEPIWTIRGANKCGFLKNLGGMTEFSWLANYSNSGYWVTVKTYSNAVDDAKITAYADYRYQTDCDLLNKLKGAPAALCGDGVKNGNEVCDKNDDAACLGSCKPDCTCSVKMNVAGSCGDCVINPGEQCEPPQKVDPVTGQILSGSPCWMRDANGAIVSQGHCSSSCQCVAGIIQYPKCGNGNCEADENGQSCPADCCGVQCVDSDNENYFAKGKVTKGAQQTEDSCKDANTLIEQLCGESKEVACPNGCENGACKPKPAPEECPDAIAVWSHEANTERNIWYSLYWDGSEWAAPSGTIRTGEAASLAVMDGNDNDPDISSYPAEGCGKAIAVWSNEAGGGAVYYSIWNTGWSSPGIVAQNGFDPAVSAKDDGTAVAVWVRNDGVYASKLTGNAWSAAVQIKSSNAVSLPQVSYDKASNKWIAVWVDSNEFMYALFDGSTWSSASPIPTAAQVQGGSLILPQTRTSVRSEWGGSRTIAAAHVKVGNQNNVLHAQLTPVFMAPEQITNFFGPSIAFNFAANEYVIAGQNADEIFASINGLGASQIAGTGAIDGRPAHTFIRESDKDVVVWHANDVDTEVYWSVKSGAGYSQAKKVVTLGLYGADKNADIAPLHPNVGKRIAGLPEADAPGCGDGVLQGGEWCDPGNAALGIRPVGSWFCPAALCTPDCKCGPRKFCGDGILDPLTEGCDPPGSLCANGKVCSNDCLCPIDTEKVPSSTGKGQFQIDGTCAAEACPNSCPENVIDGARCYAFDYRCAKGNQVFKCFEIVEYQQSNPIIQEAGVWQSCSINSETCLPAPDECLSSDNAFDNQPCQPKGKLCNKYQENKRFECVSTSTTPTGTFIIEVAEKSGAQTAVFFIAAAAIISITLLNLFRKEEY